MKVRIGLAIVFLAAVSLWAQTFRGTILGTVTDPSGAVLGGATVTVKNAGTGLERTTQTSANGSYALPELPNGTYTVTLTMSGFQTSVTSGVEVGVSSERRVDAVMRPGQVTTKVEVSGELLPQVETTSTETGGTLTSDTIESLPVNRRVQKLIYLNPGVSGSPDQITVSFNHVKPFACFAFPLSRDLQNRARSLGDALVTSFGRRPTFFRPNNAGLAQSPITASSGLIIPWAGRGE